MTFVTHIQLTRIVFASAILLNYPASLLADNQEYAVKAAFIEKFTHFITWPQDSKATDANTTFNICVAGKNPFIDNLDRLAKATKIKGKQARTFYIDPGNKISHCDIIFISKIPDQQLKNLVARVSHNSALTISDTPSYAAQGVMINFYSQKSFIGFEININASQRSGFEISSRLLKLARIIEAEGSSHDATQ